LVENTHGNRQKTLWILKLFNEFPYGEKPIGKTPFQSWTTQRRRPSLSFLEFHMYYFSEGFPRGSPGGNYE